MQSRTGVAPAWSKMNNTGIYIHIYTLTHIYHISYICKYIIYCMQSRTVVAPALSKINNTDIYIHTYTHIFYTICRVHTIVDADVVPRCELRSLLNKSCPTE